MIVVVGSYNCDLTYTCARFPRPGETVPGAMRSGPGGKGANQAVAARRAGAETAFVAAVGADGFADEARSFLAGEGLDLRLTVIPEAPTGTAAILLDASAENQIVVAAGANAALAPSHLPPELFSRAQVVVGQLECSPVATLQAFVLAKAAGATTILNPAPLAQPLEAAFLSKVDWLIPNEGECAALLRERGLDPEAVGGDSMEALHAACRALTAGGVVVTLGARGCLVSHEGGWHYVPGHRGITVVDTVGAGDAFVGAFAAGMERFEGDPVKSAEFANAGAALAVTRTGAAPAMPRRNEIELKLKW